jgi:hypothetical protein
MITGERGVKEVACFSCAGSSRLINGKASKSRSSGIGHRQDCKLPGHEDEREADKRYLTQRKASIAQALYNAKNTRIFHCELLGEEFESMMLSGSSLTIPT